jgi:hypothetical protein
MTHVCLPVYLYYLQFTSVLAGSRQYCTKYPKISRITIHIYSLLFKRCIHPLCDWCLSNIDGILLLRLRSLLLTREHIPHDAQNLAHSQQTHHRKAENLTSIVAIPPLSISCQQPQEKPTVKLSIWLRFECWGCGWQPMRLRDGTNDLQLGPLLPQFGWVINSNHLSGGSHRIASS